MWVNMYFPPFQIVYGLNLVSFICGWMMDRLLGDPERWPHPVVYFGRVIAYGERRLNRDRPRRRKGRIFAVSLIVLTFVLVAALQTLLYRIHPACGFAFTAAGVFYCLAGKTLEKEVTMVFEAVERSPEEGRRQVQRIVGRDTAQLSPQEVRLAALETLSENLSDGVIAPMFWFALCGLPGMAAYKMVNTLDSMIGYKTERYLDFGAAAARIDDVANYIPARLTALFMLLVTGNWHKHSFVSSFGKAHASPNSGYPEAALAAILDCRFGGTHNYFGKPVVKPYIGTNDRVVTMLDLQTAVQVNRRTELLVGLMVCILI